ncbi:hypothetical protein F8984_08770, partial [Campylobacter coli]|nr:hypothetical protein [Campylobacter coli]
MSQKYDILFFFCDILFFRRQIQNNIKFGVSGEYIGNYFSTNSLKSIDEIFYENPDSNKILNYHVDKWIKEILDLE